MKKIFLLISIIIISISGFAQVPRARVLIGQDTSTGKGGVKYYDTLKTLVCIGCSSTKSGPYSDTIVVSGGGGTPGGSNTQVQYNASGSFGGDGAFVWDATNHRLGIGDRAPTTLLDLYKLAASSTITVESGFTTGYASQTWTNNSGNAVQIQMIGATAGALGIAASGSGNIQCANCDLNIQARTGKKIFFGVNSVEVGQFDGTQFKVTGNFAVIQASATATANLTSNLNSGYAYYFATNNSGNSLYQGIAGSTAASFHSEVANSAFLRASLSASAFVIQADGSAPMIFDINNGEVGRFNTSRDFLMGTTVDNGIITAAGNISPEANATRDLGTPSFIWRNLYSQHLTSGATGGTFGGGSLGSGATNASSGSDQSGIIDFTTGTGPGTSATLMTVTFGNSFAYPNGCRITLTPANANAAALTGATQVFVGSTATTNWTMKSGSSALANATQYQWYYHVFGF